MFEVSFKEWMDGWMESEEGLCVLYMALHTSFGRCLLILM